MTHADLVQRAAYWLRNSQRCHVVLTERGAGGEIPDAIGWGHSALIVECKVSRVDFFADLKKPHRSVGMGHRRYYLTPPQLLTIKELPSEWGLLEAHPRCIRTVVAATVRAERHLANELRLVLSELSRYQHYGITYPKVTVDGWAYGDWEVGEIGRMAQQATSRRLDNAAYELARAAGHAAVAGGWLRVEDEAVEGKGETCIDSQQ